ncbi:MAG: helix-turn-helix domain-containing protein [Lachnospiraceae bacterium]|nr:helix-turn-helix domain-containing protein [Lachnospiraceae bacterium]MDN4741996.1 helix-turn-helix domain-containing protein [Lachnospiraceae bacterium C1.1]
MIANQLISSCIRELKEISKVDFAVLELDGTAIASTMESIDISPLSVRSFIDSTADSQVIGNYHLFRINDDEVTAYVLMASGATDNVYLMGRVAVSELGHLMEAYKEKLDRNNFFQNLLLDNMLLVDIYNRAKKLHIRPDVRRAVFIVEAQSKEEGDNSAVEIVRSLFSDVAGDFVTAVDEQEVILIKSLEDSADEEETMKTTAATIVDMMSTEAMISARVAYGTAVGEIREVSKSYKEARMALDVGKIFYAERNVASYSSLGIGRLIYQLPENLCRIFLNEIFGENIPDHMDEETLLTINKFFENNLNVSETSRQLFIHRNTLVYRIEKIEKASGLDIRSFEDALTLKIALMVVNYLKYLETREY